MDISRQRKQLSSFSFWLFIIALIVLGVWSLVSLRQTAVLYDGILHMEADVHAGSVAKITLPGSSHDINVPDWSLLRPGKLLSLASNKHPLPTGFTAPELVKTAVAHGDSNQPMQVQRLIESPLKRLYAAAEDNGIELMLSSAYRSVSDQQALYENFVAKQGKAMADIYVAKPGTSEHHTGLAVDLASASAACEINSDSCSLSQAAAAWLQENAPTYGFIQRYPEGKQPLTGVAFEPWHYRYVGVPMARAVAASDLTYDEVVRQLALGYAK